MGARSQLLPDATHVRPYLYTSSPLVLCPFGLMNAIHGPSSVLSRGGAAFCGEVVLGPRRSGYRGINVSSAGPRPGAAIATLVLRRRGITCVRVLLEVERAREGSAEVDRTERLRTFRQVSPCACGAAWAGLSVLVLCGGWLPPLWSGRLLDGCAFCFTPIYNCTEGRRFPTATSGSLFGYGRPQRSYAALHCGVGAVLVCPWPIFQYLYSCTHRHLVLVGSLVRGGTRLREGTPTGNAFGPLRSLAVVAHLPSARDEYRLHWMALRTAAAFW